MLLPTIFFPPKSKTILLTLKALILYKASAKDGRSSSYLAQ